MTDQITEDQMLSLSDDEILNMTEPPKMEASSSGSNAEGQVQQENENGEETRTDAAEGQTGQGQQGLLNPLASDDSEAEVKEADGEGEKSALPAAEDDKEAASKSTEAEAPAKDDSAKEEKPAAETVDYEAAYKKIMAPFKASGRMIQLQDPDEAIALMQRGVDYTRKMQQLKPNLKLMQMLQNNGLLSEEKINLMIDLDKKNPDAINKFLRDRQIDPLDLDTSKEPEYKPGNHAVSDAELHFNSVLEDVRSTPTGRETVQVIENEWDRASQQRIFAEPEILKLMDNHRSSGIYGQITGEIERLKLLGTIPENTPFLDAYKAVGDILHTSGRLTENGVPTNQVRTQQAPQPRQVIESRPAVPKPQVQNSEAARAAAPVRVAPKRAVPADFNPLAMSDEDFEKQTTLRL